MKTFFKPFKPASFFIFFSLMAGIIAGNYFSDNKAAIFPGIFVFLPLVFLFFYFPKKKGFLILLGLALCLGYLLIQIRLAPGLPSHHISNFLDSRKIMITGQVVSFARHYKRKQQIILFCRSIQIKEHDQKRVAGKIKLNLYGFSGHGPKFGDIIQFKSSIKSIRNFMNPGAFDYKRFLKLKGIYGSAYTDIKKIKVLTQINDISIFTQFIRKIEEIRTNYYLFIQDHTNRSNAGKIMTSLITGKKEIIPPDIRELFSKTGISHLLAISGLHLSIVSFLCFWVFYRVFSFSSKFLISGRARKTAGLFTIFPLVAYAVFSGFSASTQRALIMIIILLVSFISEKEKDILSSLSFAGILILLIDSAALFSISFQLSFTAVVFIIAGMSLVKKYSLGLDKNLFSKIILMVCITFFASIGTLPLTAHYFNMISLIGLLSNLIAIPIMGLIVLPLGLLCLACFSYFPFVAVLIIHVCTGLISFLIWSSAFLVSIPCSWVRIFSLNWIEISIIYLFFISLYFILKTGTQKAAIAAFLSLLCLISIVSYKRLSNESKPGLNITILDVGQGSSALIQTPENINILVDGGGFSDNASFDTGRFILAPFLWHKRIQSLDYVILTHPESDHLNGLIYILKNFHVHTLIKNTDKKKSENYLTLINTCMIRNIRIVNPLNGSNLFDSGIVRLLFFDSDKESFNYNFNNNSLVFKVIYNDFSMLFPGDILSLREKNLSRKNHRDLHSDILLSPHHGSYTSSSKFFLDKVQPKSVVISCGWGNRYGFPHDKILKRYQEKGFNIFRTDENGAIFISSDGKNYHIKTYKGN